MYVCVFYMLKYWFCSFCVVLFEGNYFFTSHSSTRNCVFIFRFANIYYPPTIISNQPLVTDVYNNNDDNNNQKYFKEKLNGKNKKLNGFIKNLTRATISKKKIPIIFSLLLLFFLLFDSVVVFGFCLLLCALRQQKKKKEERVIDYFSDYEVSIHALHISIIYM